MESTTTKKKKRRTRKCLNEIRKRSRRTTGGEYFGQASHQHRKIEEPQTHRLITMNRLTINMFPRAIRSETITRPKLSEIKEKSLLNCQDADKIYEKFSDSNTPIKVPETQCLEQSNSAGSKNSMPMFDIEDELQQEYVSSHVDQNANMHASPCVDMMETPTKPLATIYTTSPSQSLHASDGDHSYALYDELMNKISSHLNDITTTVIKEDIMRSTKINLQKLCNKNGNKSYDNSLTKESNISQSSIDSIVQDPLDYIKLKHGEQQGVCKYQSALASPGRSAGTARLSPVASASDSPQTHPLSTGACDVALYDTPEYNYYPHRLN